jgi:hypothetical protein
MVARYIINTAREQNKLLKRYVEGKAKLFLTLNAKTHVCV